VNAEALAGADDRLRRPVLAKAEQPLQDLLLAAAFPIFFVLAVALAFRVNINWDEYFYLSHVHAALNGYPLEPLQTIHVHPLRWLAQLPVGEADQIVYGRLFMLACEAASVACLYRIAREFAAPRDAALAAFAYLASGFVLVHGASFRADPLAGMLMMSALALLFCAPLRWWVAVMAGALAALGFLVTIKVVFFLPVAGAAFLWRWNQFRTPRVALAHFAMAGLVAAVVGTTLFLLHAGSIAAAADGLPVGKVGSAASSAGAALDKVILSQALFPRWSAIQQWLLLSALPLILVAIGGWSALAMLRKGQRLRGAALLCLLAPLVVLAIYRNAYAYFFPFIFLPPAIVAAVGASRLGGAVARNALIVAMIALVTGQAAVGWQREQSAQRSIAQAAHAIFPEPVPYIDRNAMLPSFPKANSFMSSWGIENMIARGVPVIRPVIESRHPPLLIDNSGALTAALNPSAAYTGPRLHPADEAAMRESYIRHWGRIWVAGKALDQASGSFTLSIPGTYTLECTGVRRIDAVQRTCGSTLSLEQGTHRWAGGPSVLRWGDHLPRPSAPPPRMPIYYRF
jgi:hypothetical protein